jgi:hypothetical protein
MHDVKTLHSIGHNSTQGALYCMKNMLTLLNEQLNIDINYSQQTERIQNQLTIKSDFLRNSIVRDIEGRLGSHVLKLSLPITEYSRYKNNTVSSIIRKNGVISDHIGHQDIRTADIIDTVFYKVSQHYTQEIFREFQNFFSNIQSVAYATEKNIINAINYNFEREYLNELRSITEFYEEIYDDIGDISASKERCNSYLTHVIGNRQKTLKLINHFLENLWSWPNRLLGRDFSNNFLAINYNELSNDYLLCRQAVSNYVICLVFEHVLSGNIDGDNKNKVIKKIERKLNKFKGVDQAIKNSLQQRDANNWQNFQWYSPYENWFRSNDRAGIHWFIQQCEKDHDFEVKEVNRIFDKSKLLLENIVIERDTPEEH